MKNSYFYPNSPLIFFFLFILMMSLLNNCSEKKMEPDWIAAENLIQNGELAKVIDWADSIQLNSEKYDDNWMKADSLMQLSKRIKIDFSLSEQEIITQLKDRLGDSVIADKQEWEDNKKLEYRYIDGEKRYFKRSVSNLIRLLPKNSDSLIIDPLDQFCLSHSADVINETSAFGQLTQGKDFVLRYRINLAAEAVPAGEIVRCWMPWPKEIHERQTNINLINVSENEYVIATDSNLQRSIYMEKVARAGEETVFEIKFSFRSFAQYFKPEEIVSKPYLKDDSLYIKYTAEQAPHILFSDRIKALTDSIVGQENNPLEIVRKIYYWIDENIPWASALEYGIMPCIPSYVLDYKKGDCGMQTLLFMTMARYKGIPVKWQSGWMLHPNEINLHDWCEVYYEGTGWVPLDMSFSLQMSDNLSLKDFYITGIDSYRMIVNDDIGADFYPPKKFFRSEPWDFQRGELEWSGGNLYFNLWDYNMKVE
ncbi:MAG: transglutaminase-like domain-containing protein [Bacteroidales bacterium]|nr:transglutaminase-like domain-containing protein [Bacteroidales bacterium]